jgi:ketosteroid isomerase-like protein
MSNVELVNDITEQFARNTDDKAVLEKHFAPEFVHWTNGRKGDLRSYAAHLAAYRSAYDRFSIPSWDELFAAEDRVVVAYTLEAKKTDGAVERIPVMAVWTIENGKVTALREVDGH